MCTLAVALGADRRWPVVVAANRDERLGRSSEGWALRSAPGGLRYAAPRDLEAGGTWIGVSERGLFAGLTNYHAPFDWYPDRSRRSRGGLVPLILAQPDVSSARRTVERLDPAAYNPFHLLVADASSAFLWWYDGEGAALEKLGPGLHLVTETSPHGVGARGDLVRSRWPVDLSPARLREVLVLHQPPNVAGTCLHHDPLYGTRSAAVLRLAQELSASELHEIEGRPCTTPPADRSALLQRLARPA
jgi:uncharacterized protein with NRDE domain